MPTFEERLKKHQERLSQSDDSSFQERLRNIRVSRGYETEEPGENLSKRFDKAALTGLGFDPRQSPTEGIDARITPEKRQQFKEAALSAPERVKETLGLSEEQKSKNKGLRFLQNVSSGIVDVGVGFPAQAAAAVSEIPEGIKAFKESPLESLKNLGKETGRQLLSAYDPREYTAEKLYEDPVGRATLALQGIGLGAGLKGRLGALKKAPPVEFAPFDPAPPTQKLLKAAEEKLALPEGPTRQGKIRPGVRVLEPTRFGERLPQKAYSEVVPEPFQTKKIVRELELGSPRPGLRQERVLERPQQRAYSTAAEEPFDINLTRKKSEAIGPEYQVIEDYSKIKADSLSDFVRKSGGIKEDIMKGELDPFTTKEGYGLKRKTGKSFDNLRESANESGFGPYETVNDFIDALTQDVFSKKQKDNASRVYSTFEKILPEQKVVETKPRFLKKQFAEEQVKYPDEFSSRVFSDIPGKQRPSVGFKTKIRSVENRETPYPESFSSREFGEQVKPQTKALSTEARQVNPLKQEVKTLEPIKKKEFKKLKKANSEIEKLSNADLLKESFGDLAYKLSEERGSVSKRNLGLEQAEITERANLARREAYNRAKKLADQTGEKIDAALERIGFTPEQAQKILIAVTSRPQSSQEVVMRQTKAGNIIPVQRGGVQVPAKLLKNIDNWKDIRTIQSQYKDLDRITERVVGKDYPEVREFLIGKREAEVTNLMDEISSYKKRVKQDVEKGLGIKGGTQISADTQLFGEKKLSLDELKTKHPNTWRQAVKADQIFRSMYDSLLNEVNKVLVAHNRDPIPRRSDYYTHFQEIGNIFEQLKTPSAIDPQLAGVSEYTKPITRWNPFAQKRKGGEYKPDAVEAFDRYLTPTLMQKHLTPSIARQRAFAEAIRHKTLAEKPLNNFLQTLQDHADAMAGKTNPMDRYLQDRVIGRRGMKLIDWAHSKIGKNTVVGNVSSAVMQTASIPSTLADVGAVKMMKGMFGTLTDTIAGTNQAMKQSPWLRRRYSDVDPLVKTKMQKGADVASIPFKVVEQFVVESSWRANFDKFFESTQNVGEAIKKADIATGRQIGSRSIGEKPLLFQSRIGSTLGQFQLEVNNMMQRYFHDFSKKSYGQDSYQYKKALRLVLSSYVFNEMYETILGYKPLFDPIDAVKEAIEMDDANIGESAGRIGGEFLSNILMGQTLAAALPDNIKKKYFGGTEIGWYGSGPPIVSMTSQGLQKLAKGDPTRLATTFATPFGGSQVRKTGEGIQALRKSKRDVGPLEAIQTLTFGPYASKEMKKDTLARKSKERKKELKKQRRKKRIKRSDLYK